MVFLYYSAERVPDLKEQLGNMQGNSLDATEQMQNGLGKETGIIYSQNKLLEKVKPAL